MSDTSSVSSESDRVRKNRKRRRKYLKLQRKMARLEGKIWQGRSKDSSDEGEDERQRSNSPDIQVVREVVPVEVHRAADEDDDNAFSMLGSDPNKTGRKSLLLHEEIVVRWTKFVRQGIDKNVKKELIEKYPNADNCKALCAPILNTELQNCLPESTLKQDKFISRCQNEMAAGLTALGMVINKYLEDIESNKDVLPKLADAAQIFTNIQNTLSSHRRYNILPHVNSECKKIFEESEIEEYLFGTNLQEKVKASQAMKKAGSEMKAYPKKTFIPRPVVVPSVRSSTRYQSQAHLNYQRPPAKVRMRERGAATAVAPLASKKPSHSSQYQWNHRYRRQP